jgi:UDP-3-O-[3-hydroxymyristoyl] glucosamine N-acyltransferase
LQEKYLGRVVEYQFSKNENVLVAFSGKNKSDHFERLIAKGVNLINLVHPSVVIPKSADMGFGNIVGQNVTIGPNVKMGFGNVFTAYSFLSHDCQIGSYNFFSTAGLAGNVSIGSSNFFGIRSTVIPNVTVGDRNTIQAGMVIDKNVANDETIFYKYKEKIIIINSD